jgi:hypothetical protein
MVHNAQCSIQIYMLPCWPATEQLVVLKESTCNSLAPVLSVGPYRLLDLAT